jgi:DNA-directed RNA polymerase subunit RPC12/RpoP
MNSSATLQHPLWRRFPPMKWPETFMLSAGGILLLGGAAKMVEVLKHPQLRDLTDPFGLPFRYVLALMGLAEMAVAWLCLFTNKRGLSLGCVALITTSLVAYRMDLWTRGWPHPAPLLGSLMEALNIAPLIADGLVTAISVYLLIGSGATFWFLGRAAKFQKMFCASCGGNILFSIQNLGRKIPCPLCKTILTLRAPENLKMSCSFCQDHIEFPAHAIGRKISCPHCNMTVILKKPA